MAEAREGWGYLSDFLQHLILFGGNAGEGGSGRSTDTACDPSSMTSSQDFIESNSVSTWVLRMFSIDANR